jgi:hypothetical protein
MHLRTVPTATPSEKTGIMEAPRDMLPGHIPLVVHSYNHERELVQEIRRPS